MANAQAERPLAEVLLIAAAFAPLLLGVSDEIQMVDPAQYAEVARRVVASGQLAHLHDAFGPYLDKPPITFWLIALCFRLFGETSFAVRLPSLVLGATLLWATARIGRELWDARTGRLAAALLGASVAFQLMVADPKIDMVVTTWMTWAVYFLLRGRRQRWAMYPAWFFAGLGILTKGPIGLVAPALAVLPEALRRRWGDPAGDKGLWSRLAPFKPLTGPLVLLAMVGPWLVESHREFGEHGPFFLLWEQSFGRLFMRTYRNETTPLFFLHTALWAFLPFVPVLLFELGRRLVAWRRAGWRLPPDETRVPLWWLFLPLAGISASSYKLPQYLYWLASPAALLAARALTRLGEAPDTSALRVLGRVQVGITAAVVALVAGLLWISFPPTLPVGLLWIVGVVAITGAGWALARRLSPEARVAALCVFTLTGFNAFFEGYLHPALLEYQPDREFGELVRKVEPRGDVLAFVAPAGATNAAAFYARRDVLDTDAPGLKGLVAQGRTRLAVVAKEALGDVTAAGLAVEPLLELPTYHTSQPRGAFLNARTRSDVVQKLVLVRVALPGTPAPR